MAKVELKGVGKVYEGMTRAVTDANITVEDKEFCVFVGPSGCGKSTLLKLLMRFWDVQSGSVSLSKKDIRTIDTASLRRAESYVTQETSLFRDTIANNIRFGQSDAPMSKVVAAAKNLYNYNAFYRASALPFSCQGVFRKGLTE